MTGASDNDDHGIPSCPTWAVHDLLNGGGDIRGTLVQTSLTDHRPGCWGPSH